MLLVIISTSSGILLLLLGFIATCILAHPPLAQLLTLGVKGKEASRLWRHQRRVLLLVAHPDDESMFFAPTLLASSALKISSLHILCLSSGNAYGLGHVRRQEMVAACSVLGVKAEDVRVLDHPQLQARPAAMDAQQLSVSSDPVDGFEEDWKEEAVLPILEAAMAADSVDTILTFDAYGVSGHPNHRAIHRAALAWLKRAEKEREPLVELWQLRSVGLWRKFWGPLDVPLAVAEAWLWKRRCLVVVSRKPSATVAAMRCHLSQLVWYRWLFVLFSTFTYVNRLERLLPEEEQTKMD
eukprot:jgi/Mesen1/3965/ME000210S03206